MAFDTTATLQAVARNLGLRTGTSTPTVNFAGASVGVTYAEQQCRWTRIADMVFFEAYVHLTSKGSSTGLFFLNLDLPYSAAFATPLPQLFTNVLLGAEDRSSFAQVVAGGDNVRVLETSNTAPSVAGQWTDAQITDDFELNVAGFFHV